MTDCESIAFTTALTLFSHSHHYRIYLYIFLFIESLCDNTKVRHGLLYIYHRLPFAISLMTITSRASVP